MTEEQYNWQCPICQKEINFVPQPVPQNADIELIEAWRKANTNSYLIIVAERGQHMLNHIMAGEGLDIMKKKLDKEEPTYPDADEVMEGFFPNKKEEKEELEEEEEEPDKDSNEKEG